MVTVSAAFPTFFVGLLFVYVFYFLLGWAPQPLGRLNEIAFSAPPRVTGAYTVDALIAGDWPVLRAALGQLVLPAVSLGLFALAPIARITRAAMLEALSSDLEITFIIVRRTVFGFRPILAIAGMGLPTIKTCCRIQE